MLRTKLYRFFVFTAVLLLSGCTYDASSDITCDDGEVDGNRICQGGFWVTTGSDMFVIDDAGQDADPNNVNNMADADTVDMGADAEEDMFVCMPETDREFCDRLGKDCGTVTGPDNCGEMRQRTCGSCVAPAVCGTDNVCACETETDDQFCQRLGADCGELTGIDNCGMENTANCGTCDGNENCGERSPNVCGCPCDIGGTCYPDGAPNPTNPCEICDPASSTTDWTINTGASCTDGDACTVNDMCTNSATCEGQPRDCSSEDTDCADGVCDAQNGNCVPQFKPDETACPDDGVACTVDQCISGTCTHNEVTAGDCRIGGACYTMGDENPSNECQACRPGMSQNSFSNKNDNTMCSGDALDCTVDVCLSGTCDSSTIDVNNCVIGGNCVNSGMQNPANDCEECIPGSAQRSYSPRMNGDTCSGDTLDCTIDQCMNGTCDSSEIDADDCLINGVCVTQGTDNPTQECEECIPMDSQIAFSPKSDGSMCSSDGLDCTVDECQSGVCDHSTLSADTCLIDGSCRAIDEENPANECEDCDPATPRAWSDNDGNTCDDSLSCTGDGICGGGSCSAGTVTSGCLISNMCIADGTFASPGSCDVCDPGTDPNSYTTLSMGSACFDDGLACTTGTCDGSGNCVQAVDSGMCAIDGMCWNANDYNTSNPCEICDPTTSQTSWTPVPSGMKGNCGGGGNCVCSSSGTCQGASC